MYVPAKMEPVFAGYCMVCLAFLEVPATKERSSFFLEPRFLQILGNSGDSCRNAQPRVWQLVLDLKLVFGIRRR
jgi:hypothetical protein